jgi:hypothetical protein
MPQPCTRLPETGINWAKMHTRVVVRAKCPSCKLVSLHSFGNIRELQWMRMRNTTAVQHREDIACPSAPGQTDKSCSSILGSFAHHHTTFAITQVDILHVYIKPNS